MVPDMSAMACDTIETTISNMNFNTTDSVITNFTEHRSCSDRGSWDSSNGVCSCFSEFIVAACEIKYNLVTSMLSKPSNFLLLHGSSESFAGNYLHMKTDRATDSGFN